MQYFRLAALILALFFSRSLLAADHTIKMAGMNYQPAVLKAKVGDSIRFVNDDSADHNVLIPTKGFGADLGTQKPGQATELTLARKGSFEAECVFHSHMLLKVTVGD